MILLKISLANQIYFEKAQLPQVLINRLIRLAAFPNPEFYKAQAMRMSVWNKPRVIGCAENYPQHIALPQGCLDSVLSFLRDNNIAAELILGTTKHDVKTTGSNLTAIGGPASAEVDLGSVWLLPPTLTLQYHFYPTKTLKPYLGAGLNYTIFYISLQSRYSIDI